MNMWTAQTRRPALVLAAGVAGTAALTTAIVSARTTSGAQQPLRVTGSNSVAATRSAPAPPPGLVLRAGGTRAMLTVRQAEAVAEESVRGRAEQVDLVDPARPSYQVSLSRRDGAETRVVVDGRTGRVLSTGAEPRDPAEARDGAAPQDGAVPQDPAEAGN